MNSYFLHTICLAVVSVNLPEEFLLEEATEQVAEQMNILLIHGESAQLSNYSLKN